MRFARGLGRSAGVGGLAAELLGQMAGIVADTIVPRARQAAQNLVGAANVQAASGTRVARYGSAMSAIRDREARRAAEFLKNLGIEAAELVDAATSPPLQRPALPPGRGAGGRFGGGTIPPSSPPPGSPVPPPSPYPASGRQFAPAGVPPAPGEDSPFAHEIYTPQSSNVFSFTYDPLASTLYVTYKAPRINPAAVGMVRGRSGSRQLRGKLGKTIAGKTNERGPLYAYFDVPVRVFQRMKLAVSKGKFVWDELRVRGTVYGHQYRYRLVQGSVTPDVGGVYIPRRATERGFRTRAVPMLGTGRRDYSQSTLPEEILNFSRVRDRSASRSSGRDRTSGRQRPGR